jgi:hypothetical protein
MPGDVPVNPGAKIALHTGAKKVSCLRIFILRKIAITHIKKADFFKNQPSSTPKQP